MLEALESGADGALLRTDDPLQARARRALGLRGLRAAVAAATAAAALRSLCAPTAQHPRPDQRQVRELAAYVRRRSAEAGGGERLPLEAARVTGLKQLGLGDRVCVDLAAVLAPGEGLLVGSFARALFLVHSEACASRAAVRRSSPLAAAAASAAASCPAIDRPLPPPPPARRHPPPHKYTHNRQCADSAYINARPFRVNAGAVCSYTLAPGGRTAYLTELSAGAEVVVVDASGRCRTALVGRCKIESRPFLMVTAETSDGQAHSLLLQNAETVRLVAPAAAAPSSNGGGGGGGEPAWRAVSVAELAVGDAVLLHRAQGGARHTGIAIDEQIVEK
jgi:3-dehydroquinate synthase class II